MLRYLIMLSGFILLTWIWWKISRNFFIFLFTLPKKILKIKKNSLQQILFNYGIFGPAALLAISGYAYTLLVFFKFFKT